MAPLKLAHSKPTLPPAKSAAAAADVDPLVRADRLFGGPSHLVLLSDTGPAVSFMGWTIGSSRADSVDADGQPARVVEIEIMFSEAGDYVVFERVETHVADGLPQLAASVGQFRSPREVRRYCETSTLDPQSDAARAAAVDHAARQWHWLKRPGRRATETLELPFAL
jgi:hypothetical protein